MDAVVIGAGVVGAACAERLSRSGRAVWVLERGPRPGGETTERNSGVVHAGLYYPAASWKTRLCVEGSRLLHEWAAARGVPHARCGKLIVAVTEAEEDALAALLAHGRAVGVAGLSMLTGEEMRAIEPEVRGRCAVLSSESGIVDPHELTRSLLLAAGERGAAVACGAEVRAIERAAGGRWLLRTARGDIEAEAVVNAAGLYADEVAAMAGVPGYRIHPCRGDYYRLARRARFSRLVYPVKAKGAPGLGIHLTIDLAGGSRLGPDALYVASRCDYAEPREDRRARFAESASRILGPIDPGDISYDTCGIRPKLRAPTDPEERDFVIARDLPGLVNLVGIESPGLTAALAIAREVEALLS